MLATVLGTLFVGGTTLAIGLGVSLEHALLAAACGGTASAAVHLALRRKGRDAGSRADHGPTVEQLSAELTQIRAPEDVVAAIERTVARWLPCESVQIATPSSAGGGPRPQGPWQPATPDPIRLALPIVFAGRALGTLRVTRRRASGGFTADDEALLRTIANQAALALAYAESHAKAEQRRREQAAAWHTERGALLETLAAEIGHEVRYPINFFRSVFQRGARGNTLDHEELEIGAEEVDRLERLVSGMRRVVASRTERRAVALTELAAHVEVLLRDALRGRRLEMDIPVGVGLHCDRDQVTQMLVNLLSNALEATEAGDYAEDPVGVAWVATRDGGDLVVWDTGPGFEGGTMQLFGAWFTTKPRGTGLGLAITHRLVRAHGWSIDATRAAKRTRFVISIPSRDIVTDESARQGDPREMRVPH